MDGGIMEMKPFIWIIAALLIIPQILAIPLPRGIDGIIYLADGKTEAPIGTNFSVCNLANGYCINGSTGYHAHSGRYSTAVKGEDEDKIAIKAWTQSIASNRTIILNGSMHNVNLLLNLQYYPPEKSSPLQNAVAIPSSHNSHGSSGSFISQQEDSAEAVSSVSGVSALGKPKESMQPDNINAYVINPLPQPEEDYVDVIGKITYNDGKSVIAGTKIKIRNANTGDEAYAVTGISGPGDYYVSVPGKSDDSIIISVYGKKQNISAEGKEKQFNFAVDMPSPLLVFNIPVFISKAALNAALGALILMLLAIYAARTKILHKGDHKRK